MHSPAGGRSGEALAVLAPRASLAQILPVAIGPEQAVAHSGWSLARDLVLASIEAVPSLTVIVGASGTGKTLLLQDVAGTLRAEGTPVWMQLRGNPDVPPMDPGSVVLIDEAERMSSAVLFELGKVGDCAVVLTRCTDPACGTVVRLTPLLASEVGAFVATRLTRAGLPARLPTEAAIARLAERSSGVPRSLNTLLSAALFLARQEGSGQIEAQHVDDAAAMRELADLSPRLALPVPGAERPGGWAARPRGILPVVCATSVVAAAIGWLAIAPGPRAVEPSGAAAPPLRAAAEPAMPVAKPTQTVAAAGPAMKSAMKSAMTSAALTAAVTPPGPATHPVIGFPPGHVAPWARAATSAQSPASVPTPPLVPALASGGAPAEPPGPIAAPARMVSSVPAASTAPTPGPARIGSSASIALPAETLAYVVLSIGPEDEATVAAKLRAAGFTVKTGSSDARPGETGLGGTGQVRYFFAEDRQTAFAVSRAAGLADPVQDDSGSVWRRPGLIQIAAPPNLATRHPRNG